MNSWKNRTLAAAGVIALAQATGAVTTAGAQTPATPQGASQTAAPEQAVKTYDPAFFARYNPVTAFDMVRQLPGFVLDNGDALRGFGATAGNVLIDGQRPSSKNAISDEHARIAARDVARIELIGAAAAGDVDVRGYTELANVVLKPAAQTQVSSTWRGDLQLQGDHISERLGGTRQWKSADMTVRLNAQLSNAAQREDAAITESNALGVVTRTREEFNQQYFAELLINGTLNWTPTARDSVNLTGRLTPRTFQRNFGSIWRNPAGVLTTLSTDDYTEKDILHAELGGDWEHKFSPQNAVKLILVNRAVTWRPQELFEQVDAFGAPLFAQEINSELKTGEHVVRGVWTLKPNDAHTIEIGVEAAFNYRDQHRAVANSSLGGPFVPVLLPIATTRVEELRAETNIGDVWRIDPKLTLELGFNYEASRITQTGDAEQEREFTYPKPRLVATWLPTKEDQLRLSVERTVAQLDFSEFASTLVPIQNQITVGNPDLEPQQVWETSLQWKRPIGERGSISLTGYYHQIDDVQDLIPIWPPIAGCPPPPTNDPNCVFTAAGNIGEGERWGVSLDTTIPLDAIGVSGGLLRLTVDTRDSKVIDPITAEERRINNDLTYRWNIDFRQDLPGLKLAWGGDYTEVGYSEAFRLNETQLRTAGAGDLDFFIETTAIKGITIRLLADNIGDQPNYLDRRFFTPNRLPGGVFSRSEFREGTIGPIYGMSVSGAF
jgi:hypothetical protein